MAKCTPTVYNGIIKTGGIFCHPFTIKAPSNGAPITGAAFTWTLPPGLAIDPSTVSNPSVGSYTQGTTEWRNIDVDCGAEETLEVCFIVEDDSLAPFKIETNLEFTDCSGCDIACSVEIKGISLTELRECLRDLDTDLKCVPKPDNSDPANPQICFDLVDNITGSIVTENVVCVPVGNITPVTPGNNITITGTGTSADPYIVNGCCSSFDPTTGELTIIDAEGVESVYPIVTAIQQGNNVVITGTGSPADPFIVNGCCVIIDPNDPTTLIITDPQGNKTTFTVPPETDLVVTTDGDTTGVNQSGPANHTVDITVTSTDEDNLATIGSDGGTFVSCEDVIACVGTDSVEVVNNEDGTKTLTHTAVDGTVAEWCVPACTTTITSEAGETFEMESNCGVQVFDLSTNDTPCETYDEDGNLISSGNGTYVLKGIDNPTNLELVALTGDGKAYVRPTDCSKAIAEGIQTCIKCPDGTISNTVTDLFTFTPPPIGEIRVDKTNDVKAGTVAAGDTFTYTITVCNEPAASGPITDITTSDVLKSPLIYTSDDGGTAAGGNVTTAIDPLGTRLTWTFAGPLAPGDCESIDVVVQVDPDSTGFEFIPNVVTAVGNDGVNGPNSTSDADINVLNENQNPEARLAWEETNGTTGVAATGSQSYVKAPSGALVACGEPFRFEVFLEEGTLWETITGTLCSADYASDRTDGLSITNFSPTGDFGNGLSFSFNKRDWANATGNIYAATGQSSINGNTPITTRALDSRTFAQELETHIFVGGQGSTTCPIESVNPDNISEICKIPLGKTSNFDAEIREYPVAGDPIHVFINTEGVNGAADNLLSNYSITGCENYQTTASPFPPLAPVFIETVGRIVDIQSNTGAGCIEQFDNDRINGLIGKIDLYREAYYGVGPDRVAIGVEARRVNYTPTSCNDFCLDRLELWIAENNGNSNLNDWQITNSTYTIGGAGNTGDISTDGATIGDDSRRRVRLDNVVCFPGPGIYPINITADVVNPLTGEAATITSFSEIEINWAY